MELHVIRHGLTVWNLEGRFNGSSDDCLTADQVRTLRCVDFSASGYDAVYCSPLERCVETARCLGIDRWIPEARIAERNLGVFEGCTSRECVDRHPEAFAAFSELDERYVVPGGESRREHLARVLAWLEEACRFERVLAIAHGGTIDFLYRLGSGLPLHGGPHIFGGGNAAMSKFAVDWPHVRLLAFDEQVCPPMMDHADQGDVRVESSGGTS